MKQSILITALLLFCIQHGCIGTPVDAPIYDGQYIYSYHGYIDTDSTETTLERWNITGDLTIQVFHKRSIFQLSNLKTSLYNGNVKDVNYTQDNISEKAEILKHQFVFHPHKSEISVEPSEPLWSLNIKRSIASNFLQISEGKKYEESVFGDCEIDYDFTDKDNIVKTINHDTCKSIPYKSNVRPTPAPECFQPIKIKTVIEIKPDGDNLPRSIYSVSTLTYQAKASASNTQHIYQHQELIFQNKSLNFYRIRTDCLTEHKHIIYENGITLTYNMHKQETDSKVLIQQYLDTYDKYEKKSKQFSTGNDTSEEDLNHDMFSALHNIPDDQGFKELQETIDNKTNREMSITTFKLLPYIGTKASVKYIYNRIMKSDSLISPYYAVFIFANFPNNINEPTERIVKSLEGLLNLENVQSNFMRNGRILSFAAVVARSFEQRYIGEEIFKKYQKIYYDKFLGSEKYEQKMMYILGLINMAEGLSTDFMLSIIKNTTTPASLRSLALTRFKTVLLKCDNEIFDTFWPIVQDKKENFDVRVAALDLLLSSELDEEQFNTILEVFKCQTDNVQDKHLTNYLLSTLESLQNSTGHEDPLGELARSALETDNFSKFPRSWTTCNCHLHIPKRNTEGYIHTRLTANPVQNTISTVQVSLKNFKATFETGVYTIYLKLHGVMENFSKEDLFKKLTNNSPLEFLQIPVEEGAKMLKDNKNFNIEMALFNENKVIFAMHFDNENLEENKKYLDNIMDVSKTPGYSFRYASKHYTHITSILGTPINIMKSKRQASHLGIPGKEFIYQSVLIG